MNERELPARFSEILFRRSKIPLSAGCVGQSALPAGFF